MINIKDTVKLPSTALQLMVDGLQRQSQRSDFKINMGTYGDEVQDTCFGCAATCTIQELAGKNLTKIDIGEIIARSIALGFDVDELREFEGCIDMARQGHLYSLFYFLGFGNVYDYDRYDLRFFLDHNWRDELQAVEQLIGELKKNGL